MSRIETVEVGGTEYTLGADKDSTVTFTEAQTRTNIASGESLATMFGKIKKFFTDLKTVAFTGNVADMSDVTITSPASGDTLFHNGTGWENKNLMVEVTKAEYDALVANNEDDPNVDYHITDIDVAEAYYVETSGQTALTGATTLTFTNSHIKPTADIRILAEPASCKVATNPQYKVSAKLSSVGNGTATITFPALAENTEFWLLIECPLAVTVDPSYVYNTDETVIGEYLGHTLYRKVITGITLPTPSTDGASSNKFVSVGVAFTKAITVKGVLDLVQGTFVRSIQLPYFQPTSSNFGAYQIGLRGVPNNSPSNANSIELYNNTSSWGGLSVDVIIEYIKD